MTNMEFYRDEIEEIMDEGHDVAVTKDGVPVKCRVSIYCNECALGGQCERELIKWLMSEHEDKPTITARERHLLEFIQTGWIARDTSDGVWWFKKRPEKREAMWDTLGSRCHITGLVEDVLSFIDWEDKEPWSVEELLKLEVVE